MTVTPVEIKPIRPRKLLFWVLMGVYFVFLGGLVLMWFETVHGVQEGARVPTEIKLVLPQGPVSRP